MKGVLNWRTVVDQSYNESGASTVTWKQTARGLTPPIYLAPSF